MRRRFVEDGLAAALERKAPARTYVRRLDGLTEAQLIALTCVEPPSGCARWTLRLRADRLVELEIGPSVCHETVRQTLRAKDLKPWLQRQWGIAPTASADFVCHMEDVLEVYHRPFDPLRPVVCLDQTTQQLVSETRTPRPAAAGRSVRHDYEYERQGVATLFRLCAPLQGWREISVRERRTRVGAVRPYDRRPAAERGLDLSESFAYSDSETDIPMLLAVGHPFAVNPDRTLTKVAHEREWPILSFTHKVRAHDGHRSRTPFVVSAAVLGVLALIGRSQARR